MVNNYPEYAAGVTYKKTDTNGNRHFYSAQVVADPDNETVESKLIKDGVVIDEGGGGGASDFTTVEVEILVKNTTEEEHTETSFVVYAPCILELDNSAHALIAFDGTATAGGTFSSGPVDIILYKGHAILPSWQTAAGDHFYPTVAPTVTGDIAVENDGSIVITGSGTITFACDYSE